jgi:hypothetical protein
MKSRIIFSLLSLAVYCSPEAQANSYSLSGNFSQDDNIQFLSFSISAPSDVSFATHSYVDGGFLPVLSLWNNAGSFLGDFYSISLASDVSTSQTLTVAGTYFLAITEYNNLPNGDLPNGTLDPAQFSQYGNANFTVPAYSYTPSIPGAFIAPDGSQRTNAWALNISTTTSTLQSVSEVSAVPLPATLWLFGSALLGLLGFSRQKTYHS